MAGRGPATDEERLPWLESPHRDTLAHKRRVARRSHGGLVAVAGALAVLAAAGGGYWLGQRDPTPAARPPVSDVALAPVRPAPSVPVTPVVPQPAAEMTPPAVAAAPPAEAEARPVVENVAAPAPRKVVRRAERPRKIRNAATQSTRQAQVRAAQRRSAQKRAAVRSRPRAWPRMPSPGPAGQVIQLGAFRNPSGANRAYRTRVARYPALRSMPRVVVPVITKPQGQVLYVLRLGTSSRQQSRIVCRNLRASGNHCLVIG